MKPTTHLAKQTLTLLLLLAMITACTTTQKPTTTVSLQSPFIGGSQGLTIAFQDLRKEVFDNGEDPFDISIKLENKGETLLTGRQVKVTLSGFNPKEFNRNEEDLKIQDIGEELIDMRKTPQGTILIPSPIFVDFQNFNYKNRITGDSAEFTIRADVCYWYQTKAVSKLCVRKDILKPKAGGICEINQDKPVYNSGAPLQVSNFRESAHSKGKISFTFDIRNIAGGYLFDPESGSPCDRNDRKQENKVYVKVNTGLSNTPTCSGLPDNVAAGVGGAVTLYDGTKTITCTQDVKTGTDFEQLVNIEVEYNYEQSVQSTFTVKSSGEEE